jgi:hypothetical protein
MRRTYAQGGVILWKTDALMAVRVTKEARPRMDSGGAPLESKEALASARGNGLLVFLLLPALLVGGAAGGRRRVIGLTLRVRRSHLAVALKENALVDDQTRRLDVAFDV